MTVPVHRQAGTGTRQCKPLATLLVVLCAMFLVGAVHAGPTPEEYAKHVGAAKIIAPGELRLDGRHDLRSATDRSRRPARRLPRLSGLPHSQFKLMSRVPTA